MGVFPNPQSNNIEGLARATNVGLPFQRPFDHVNGRNGDLRPGVSRFSCSGQILVAEPFYHFSKVMPWQYRRFWGD